MVRTELRRMLVDGRKWRLKNLASIGVQETGAVTGKTCRWLVTGVCSAMIAVFAWRSGADVKSALTLSSYVLAATADEPIRPIPTHLELGRTASSPYKILLCRFKQGQQFRLWLSRKMSLALLCSTPL